MFGPPVPVAPDEAGQVIVVGVDTRDSAGQPVGKRAALGDEEFRRSLYIQVRRSLPLGLLETFDAPAMTPNCERRASSTVAPQSLLLMNNDFVVEQSEAFAARRRRGGRRRPRGAGPPGLAAGARPRARRRRRSPSAVAFLAEQRDDFAAPAERRPRAPKRRATRPDRLRWPRFCQALFELERVPVCRLNRPSRRPSRCRHDPRSRSHAAATSWPARA